MLINYTVMKPACMIIVWIHSNRLESDAAVDLHFPDKLMSKLHISLKTNTRVQVFTIFRTSYLFTRACTTNCDARTLSEQTLMRVP